jgi:hypothetical protein
MSALAALLLGESELEYKIHVEDISFENSKIFWRELSNLGLLFKRIEEMVDKSNSLSNYGI